MTNSDAAKPLRVLVVEDSLTQAIFLRQKLVRSGFEVQIAANGREALAEIDRHLPTLVLTDLDMPELDGLSLVEQLRERRVGVPIILMTAQGSEEIAVRALKAGAAGYVPKRQLDRDLGRTMERVLAIWRSSQSRGNVGEALRATGSQFVLPNESALIAPLVRRLQAHLARLDLFDQTEQMRLGMALREAIINAMEHGNLEASSELRDGDDTAYAQLLAERRAQQPYAARRVRVTAHESQRGARYVVADEGPGFDPRSLPDPTDPANLEKTCGRGLLLMQAFMDEVSFNAAGNEVTLVKHREPTA